MSSNASSESIQRSGEPNLPALAGPFFELASELPTGIAFFSEPPLDRVSPLAFANQALLRMAGISRDDLEAQGWLCLLSRRADRALVQTLLTKIRAGAPAEAELPLATDSPENEWGYIRFLPPSGSNRFWMLTLENVSARKAAEDAVERERDQLSVTLRSIAEGVISVNHLGLIDFINLRAEQLTGYRPSEAYGQPWNKVFQLICEQDKVVFPFQFEQVLRSGKAVYETDGVLLFSPTGDHRKIRFSASPIMDRRGQLSGGVIVFSDITEQNRLEREMQRNQKMESIALVTAGIAHDFNNILTGVMGNISLAKTAVEPGQQLHSVLQSAEYATQRAKDLTHQLLSYARGHEPVKEACSIRRLLNEAVTFVLSGSKCRGDKKLPEDLWQIEADAGQISQVLNNLLINATQAMPEGGSIQIEAKNAQLGAQPSLPLNPGNYVVVTIQDHGCGISAKNLAKIFDPYFTTKQHGSGLGLATSFSLIKSHHGHIAVESEEGEGTSFRLYIPAIAEQEREPQPAPTAIFKGTGRILVMDDEPMIQQIAGDMLRHLGYEVTFAPSGEIALQILFEAEEKGAAFDALVLDMTVPGGLGGCEMMSRLKTLEREYPAVLSTGYSSSRLHEEYKKHGFMGIITKPYNIEQMSWVMRAVTTAPKKP